MRFRTWLSGFMLLAIAGLALTVARSTVRGPTILQLDEQTLREYAGVYQWDDRSYVYLQLWSELTATKQLVAFDESGDVRVLFPLERDRFFAGPGAGTSSAIASRIDIQRDAKGAIASFAWQREGTPRRIARRVDIERHEAVTFSNGGLTLAGTLIRPTSAAKYPAIILVHASGAEDREYVLPFARFLVRHGIAVFGYDKRGVGGSSGSWSTASFDDLASDVVAAFDYLKSRSDIDAQHVGVLGWSQAGWIMPLAAVRASDLAFIISIAGAGTPAAETTIDQARHEMTARGAPAQAVEQMVEIMKRQYRFAESGEGWDQYASMRQTMMARMGSAPSTFPGSPDDPYWQFIRRIYFYDPVPTLRRLRTPTLALFGELDNNILAVKHKAAWEAALKAGGHPDYALEIIPKANHLMLEARVGSNAEMPSLQRVVPAYFTIVKDWLATRVPIAAQAKS